MARGRKPSTPKTFKRANGTGSIKKLSGNRRKPYMVVITKGYEYDVDTGKTRQVRVPLDYFATREEAEVFLNEYNGNPCDLDYYNITFAELFEIFKAEKAKKVKERTLNVYEYAYKHIESLQDKKLRDIKTKPLQDLIDDCPAGSATKGNIKTLLCAMYDFGMQNDIVNKNYAQYLTFDESDPVIDRTVFTTAAIEKLWQNTDVFEVKIVLILLYSGMRVNELFKMPRTDCHIEAGYMHISDAKNKASIRDVPIHSRILPLIQEFYDKDREMLVTTAKGSKINYNNFAVRNMPKINELTGENHRIHDTRHTFITRCNELKLDEKLVKKMVGHAFKDITTKVYTHITINRLIDELEKLSY